MRLGWVRGMRITAEGHSWLESKEVRGAAAQKEGHLESGPSKKIFISHSSGDKEFVSALTDLLKAAFVMRAKEILCTSVSGHKLPGGADTEEELLATLRSSNVLLGVLTPASLSSSYVLFELGARWGLGRPLISLVGCGTKMSDIKDPLKSRNALDASNPDDLHQLIEDVATLLQESPEPVPAYSEYIRRLAKAAAQQKTRTEATNQNGPAKPRFSSPISWGNLVEDLAITIEGPPGCSVPFYRMASRKKLHPYTEHHASQPLTHCAGLSLRERSDWFDPHEGTITKDGVRQYDFTAEATLWETTAPLIDAWKKKLKLQDSYIVQIRFKYGVEMEREPHRLNTNIHGSEIEAFEDAWYGFRKLRFSLHASPNGSSPRFRMLVAKTLAEIP